MKNTQLKLETVQGIDGKVEDKVIDLTDVLCLKITDQNGFQYDITVVDGDCLTVTTSGQLIFFPQSSNCIQITYEQ